jgi:hypothetical protein
VPVAPFYASPEKGPNTLGLMHDFSRTCLGMYFIKRKQNTKCKHIPKLRRNLAWLNKATQAARAATTEDSKD